MNRMIILAICVFLSFVGCSTARGQEVSTKSVDSAATSKDIHAAYEGDVRPGSENLPLEMQIVGRALEHGFHEVTVQVAARGEWLTPDRAKRAGGQIHIEPDSQTEVHGQALDAPFQMDADGLYQMVFMVRGAHPAVRVSARVVGQGFAAEVHDEYAPDRPKAPPKEVEMKPLPAAIEVNGMVIERGVEVRP